MNYNDWKKYYKKLLIEFNFSEKKDMKSAELLSSLLENKFLKLDELKTIINGKKIFVLGDSPYFSLSPSMIEGKVIISADDATKKILELGYKPDIVITDLDSPNRLIMEASMMGSIIGVHAHGDNIEKLKIVESFELRFGTTQAFPLWNVYNFGGFTDGDRAVFLAEHFKPRSITIAGFNFYDPNMSKGKDIYKKFKKLIFSKYLLEELIRRSEVKIEII
ncbi:MAG: 6-hydroxymethylpterin diphosphokinase MptE-like protein [Thermoplasmata archaeon]